MDDPKPGCSGIQKRKFDTICDEVNSEENCDGRDIQENRLHGSSQIFQNEQKYEVSISSAQRNCLINLPDDVMYIVGRHLKPFDLYSLSRTCLRFHHLVTERSLWKNIDFRDTTDITTNLLYHFNRFLSPSTIAYNIRGRCLERYPPSVESLLMTANLLKEIKSKCPELKTLRIEDDILIASQIGMKDLPESLEVLSLSGSILWNKPVSISYFFRIEECLPRLTTICLRNCAWFEPHSLMLLSKVRLLQHLDLSHCTGLSECMAYFSLSTRYGFLQLKTFDLRNTYLCDSEISCLNSLPKLTEILLDCPVSPQAMRPDRVTVEHFNIPNVQREFLPIRHQDVFFLQGNRDHVNNAGNNRIHMEIMRNPGLIQGLDLEVNEGDVLNAQFPLILNQLPVQRRADNIRIMNDNLGDYPEIFQPEVEEHEIRNENEHSSDSDDLESDNVFHPPCIDQNMAQGLQPPRSQESIGDVNIIPTMKLITARHEIETVNYPNLVDPSPNNRDNKEYETNANVTDVLNKTESDNVDDQNSKAPISSKRDNLREIVKPNDKTTQTCSIDVPLRYNKRHSGSRNVKKTISIPPKKRKVMDEMDQYLERRSLLLEEQMSEWNVLRSSGYSPGDPTINSTVNQNAEFTRHSATGVNYVGENLARVERDNVVREEFVRRHPMNIDGVYEPVFGVLELEHFPHMNRERNVLINLEFGFGHGLSRCFISDRAICSFGSSPASNSLNLVRIQANYMPQQREPILERLTIRNYRLITDQSLRHLSHAAPKLRFLDVTGTNVTKEGVNRFKEERPDCEILSDFRFEQTD